MNSSFVERVSDFRFLGLHLDDDLFWKTKITSLVKKVKEHPSRGAACSSTNVLLNAQRIITVATLKPTVSQRTHPTQLSLHSVGLDTFRFSFCTMTINIVTLVVCRWLSDHHLTDHQLINCIWLAALFFLNSYISLGFHCFGLIHVK